MRPVVSIVTTSYNQEAFLEETICSVLEQDYPRIEYLVIDDGSTDSSAEVIERYADRLTWWTRQDNAGQAAALNRGFARATGELMAFLSSDDTLLPGTVSCVVDEFARDPDLLVVYGDVYLTNERSERITSDVSIDWDLARMARQARVPHQPATFWSRRAWEVAGPFDERSWGLFDVEFGLRLAAAGRGRHVRKPLATFRLHERSKQMSRRLTMAREHLRCADEFFASPDLPPQLRPYARAARATLYRRAALHFDADGETPHARRLFLRSLVMSPRGLTRKQLVRLLKTLVPDAFRRRTPPPLLRRS